MSETVTTTSAVTSTTSAVRRGPSGRLRLTHPTRGYAVTRNPFAVAAVLPLIVAGFMALEVAILFNVDPVVACGGFLAVTCGLLLIPAVSLKGSLNLTHDGLTFERGKDHLTAGWDQIQGLEWNRDCGLAIVVRNPYQTRPSMRLPGGFCAQGGIARIPLRMFGDRQYSIVYDLRDQVPESGWMPAVDRAAVRATERNLAIYAAVVAIGIIAMVTTAYAVTH